MEAPKNKIVCTKIGNKYFCIKDNAEEVGIFVEYPMGHDITVFINRLRKQPGLKNMFEVVVV